MDRIMAQIASGLAPRESTAARAAVIFNEQRQIIFERTDRLFAGLMVFQWLFGIVLALMVSPRAWAGQFSHTHLHLWAALFLGGAILGLPVYLALMQPGKVLTRHTIAIGQMLDCSLLIYLTGGRIENLFHIYVSLAFLAFYRDWHLLISASAIVYVDHFLRGVYWPQSVYGVLTASSWRAVEHAGLVIFEVLFLMKYIDTTLKEMMNAAQRQASLEAANESIEQKVIQRTARLEVTQVLAEATTVREALPRVLRAAGESLGWDVGAFWVVDRGDHVLHCLELWHEPVLGVAGFEAASRGASFAPGVGLPGRVWSGGQPVWIPDVTADQNFPRALLAVQEGLHGAFACPVRVEGEILGVIEFFSRRVQQPDEDLLEMMATIGGQIGQFMERRRAEEGLRRSEARKAAILEAALDCIITIDHEERILEFNPAAERTFGHARGAVLGRSMGELIVPPHYREAHRRGLRRYLATGEGPVL